MITVARAESMLAKMGGQPVKRDRVSQEWRVNGQTIHMTLANEYGESGPDRKHTHVAAILLNGYAYSTLSLKGIIEAAKQVSR